MAARENPPSSGGRSGSPSAAARATVRRRGSVYEVVANGRVVSEHVTEVTAQRAAQRWTAERGRSGGPVGDGRRQQAEAQRLERLRAAFGEFGMYREQYGDVTLERYIVQVLGGYDAIPEQIRSLSHDLRWDWYFTQFSERPNDLRAVLGVPTQRTAVFMSAGQTRSAVQQSQSRPPSPAQGRRANEMLPRPDEGNRNGSFAQARLANEMGMEPASMPGDLPVDWPGSGPGGGGPGQGAISDAMPDIAAMSDSELEAHIRRTYGYAASFLAIPEIRDLLFRAAREGWDEARLAGGLQATRWWRSTNATAREWAALEGADPATAQARVDARITEVAADASRLGANLSPERARTIARDSLRFGWTRQQTQAALVAEVRYDPQAAQAGEVQATARQAKELARAYMLTIGDDTAFQYATRIATGALSIDGLEAMFAQQAKGRFVSLAPQIDAGVRPAEFFEPYRQQIASELEMSPAEVDFVNNPQFSAVIDHVAPGEDPSKRRPMTLAETQRYVRSLPQWDRTRGANQQAASLGNYLTRMFGRTG